MIIGHRNFHTSHEVEACSHTRTFQHCSALPAIYLIALESLLIYQDFQNSTQVSYFQELLRIIERVPDYRNNSNTLWLANCFSRNDVQALDCAFQTPQFTQWISEVVWKALNPCKQVVPLEEITTMLPVRLHQPHFTVGTGIHIYVTVEGTNLVCWYPKLKHYGTEVWKAKAVPSSPVQQSLPVLKGDSKSDLGDLPSKLQASSRIQCVLCGKAGKDSDVFKHTGLEYHVKCFRKSLKNKKWFERLSSLGIQTPGDRYLLVKEYFQVTNKRLKACARCRQSLSKKKGCGCSCGVCCSEFTICWYCGQETRKASN